MADKKKNQEEEVLVDVGATLSSAEQFIEKNKKTLTRVIGFLVVFVGGIWAYYNWYVAPNERAAQEEMVSAIMAFEKDSLESALNGAGSWSGFLEVAEAYSGTRTGNLAHFYAGVAHLNLKQFEDAIRELDQFDPKDEIMSLFKLGAIADAFVEIGQPEDGLDYYRQAVSGSKNEFLTPFYLKKAGLTAEMLGAYSEAADLFQRIADEFPESKEGTDAFKYVERARSWE
jgi:tetratricopeptide (TPR) repeat protein